MTKQELHDFMTRHKLGVLSTQGPDRAPQSALMGMAVGADLEIVVNCSFIAAISGTSSGVAKR
ncbi:MAG: hypothetical protein O3A53_13300 [Acidobacteria bacterium]|nr:hypothetical protein [Acidobacteriota bacterium]MDA1235763.1 hypothetical protein [Acidobacteriota bacterium]